MFKSDDQKLDYAERYYLSNHTSGNLLPRGKSFNRFRGIAKRNKVNLDQFQAALHEVGHLVLHKSWIPQQTYAARIFFDKNWRGEILFSGGYPHSIEAGKVIVAGLAAEYLFESLWWKDARKIFQNNTHQFGGDFENYKSNIARTKDERLNISADASTLIFIDDEYSYFKYLYDAALHELLSYGKPNILRLVESLYFYRKVTI